MATLEQQLEVVGLHPTGHAKAVGLPAEPPARLLAERAAGDVPDGLIVVTDQLANGVMHELHTVAGIRVPHDVAVIGCENNRAAGTATMPLTAVDLPGRTMGQEAIRLLMDEVSSAGNHRHATVLLEPELIVRASAPHAS